jgi:hypothetical protein
MRGDKVIEIFRWLNEFCKINSEHIGLLKYDCDKLLNDEIYAKKIFLKNYAYARANAPLSYKINAIKALNKNIQNSHKNPIAIFNTLVENPLTQSNPFTDTRFAEIKFNSIISNINNGHIVEAFESLALKGVGSKIKTLFIRDIVYLFKSENKISSRDEKLFTQPIDIWIKLFMDEIPWKTESIDKKNEKLRLLANQYSERWKDIERGKKIIEICEQANVSPVLVNQAIWLFSSRVVSDTKHLKKLVNSGDVGLFQQEASLVDEYFI